MEKCGFVNKKFLIIRKTCAIIYAVAVYTPQFCCAQIAPKHI